MYKLYKSYIVKYIRCKIWYPKYVFTWFIVIKFEYGYMSSLVLCYFILYCVANMFYLYLFFSIVCIFRISCYSVDFCICSKYFSSIYLLDGNDCISLRFNFLYVLIWYLILCMFLYTALFFWKVLLRLFFCTLHFHVILYYIFIFVYLYIWYLYFSILYSVLNYVCIYCYVFNLFFIIMLCIIYVCYIYMLCYICIIRRIYFTYYISF